MVFCLLLDLPQVKFTAEALGREVMIEFHQAVRPGHDSVPVGIGVVGESNVDLVALRPLTRPSTPASTKYFPPAPAVVPKGARLSMTWRVAMGSAARNPPPPPPPPPHGAQAQFNHPDLGGTPGQWSQGGTIMIGDMFNQGFKHCVDLLCREIASLLRSPILSLNQPDASHSQSQRQSGGYAGVSLFIPGSGRSSSNWWPAELGSPASTGAQNNLQYAVSRSLAALAIRQGDRVSVLVTPVNIGGRLFSAAKRRPISYPDEPARTCSRRRLTIGQCREPRSARSICSGFARARVAAEASRPRRGSSADFNRRHIDNN